MKHSQATQVKNKEVGLGYEDLEERLDQYWKYTAAALAGILVFQAYRQHLIYQGIAADTVMSMLIAILCSLAYIGAESVYAEYFEVSGQSESPKIE